METITVERAADGVVTITLNRPERKNAVNTPMWDELFATLKEIGRSDDDRCVVLTGAGGDFCSGADLSGTGEGPRRHQLANMRDVRDVILALYHLPQPTIAKVRGVAVGVGMSFAMACDLVVASDTARFSEIFAKRGLSLDGGASWLLPRRIGLHRAKELALFADIIGAAEAERIGLVNRVVADAEVDAAVADWARRLAGGPPIALAQSKRMLNNSMMVTLEQALEDEGTAQTVNFGTKDTPEAIAAWIEKREPRFHRPLSLGRLPLVRRGVVLVATATALLVASSPGAWAGGQEEPGPGTVVTVPPEPGAETPLPSTTAPAPTTTVPGGTTLPTLPPKCEPLPPAKVVFIGRLTAAAGGVGRFQVDAVRSDPGGLLAIGRLVDVGLGSDLRYLELDSRYLVGAEDDGAGGLRSKVHQPQPLFGGDQVVGLNDADPDCPAFVDPIVVRRADGSAVDTGVFSGFIDDQRGIGLAFLKPAAAVVGVLVGLVLLKYLLIGIGKGSVRAWRRLRYGPAGRRRPLTTPGR